MAGEVKQVRMADGRDLEFRGKQKLQKSNKVVDGKIVVTLDFVNGQTRSWTIPDELVAICAGHGAEQKLGDETAGVEDVEDMIVAVDDMISRLNKLEWRVKREGGGVKGASVVIQALAEFTKKPVDEIKAFLNAKLEADETLSRQALYASFRVVPEIKTIIDRLEAQKLKGSGEVAAGMLADLKS